MRCAESRTELSAWVDGELDAPAASRLAAHVASCAACRRYRATLTRVAATLRLEPVGEPVDLVPRVRAAIAAQARAPGQTPPAPTRLLPRRPPRRDGHPEPRGVAIAAAAVFVAAAVAGAAFVGFGRGPEPGAAAGLPDRVLVAQRAVHGLRARVEVVERNWHPDVPVRRFTGTLAYRAPESLAVHLDDRTRYPSGAWVPNDTDLVVDGARAWTRGVAACPVEALPGCTPPAARARGQRNREPFPDAAPAPLDLVVPVESLALGEDPPLLGTRRIDGRPAIGVRVDAAQVAPVLAGLQAAGNWRPLHPLDVADLWLDRAALVPREITVAAAADAERREWAASHGLPDEAGDVILSVRFLDVEIGAPARPGDFPPPPPDAVVRDAGFTDRAAAALAGPSPAYVPPGLHLARAGVLQAPGGPRVAVRAWTDGRAWLKVSTTREWRAPRLFGELGAVVRRVELGSGTGYVDERGAKVAVHGGRADAVVTGSLPEPVLRRVAASLGVRGRDVPSSWPERGTVTVAQARAAHPGLLVPAAVEGFAAPAVRAAGGVVSLAYAGPGARGFLLVQAPGDRLGPPFDVDARAVAVRGTTGRWSPSLGSLEWTEGGRRIALTSATLGRDELLALAASLEASLGAAP